MKEQFVNHLLAAALKKKGFDLECMAFYEISIKARKDEHDGFSGPFGWEEGEINFNKGYFVNNGFPDNSNEYWLICGAPLWQQVIDWLDINHNLEITIKRSSYKRYWWHITKLNTEDKIKGYSGFSDTKIAALSKVIQTALELI